jgi:hypothetical protein
MSPEPWGVTCTFLFALTRDVFRNLHARQLPKGHALFLFALTRDVFRNWNLGAMRETPRVSIRFDARRVPQRVMTIVEFLEARFLFALTRDVFRNRAKFSSMQR